MPRISIITVNLNNLAGLSRTVASVSGQTGADLEHLVIDGDSNDGSREFLEGSDSPFLKWISEKDKGIYDAMNKGIEMAGGEYLLFLNSGDVLDSSDVISRVVPALNKGYGIVYGDLRFDDGQQLTDGFMPDKIDLDHMMRDTLWHPASFIRKDLFMRYGPYDTSFRLCGDYEFFFRVLIVNSVTAHHVSLFIARFDLRGLTSDIRNHELVRSEKAAVYARYPGVTAKYKPSRPGPLSRLRQWFR